MSRRRSVSIAAKRAGTHVREHYLLVLLAIAITMLVGLVYFLLGGTWAALTPGLAANFVSTPLVFVVVYLFVIRPGVSLPSMSSTDLSMPIVTISPTHDEVDWAAIIRNAKHLDIVVHYYDAWVRDYHQEFVTLFQRGGRVRLILPDPELGQVMETVQREFFPRHTVDRLVEKVLATAQNLREALDAAGSQKATLEVYAFPAALHYAAVIADERQLYLSVYEQFRGPTIGSQVFGIDLFRDSKLDNYWNDNIDRFIKGSRPL